MGAVARWNAAHRLDGPCGAGGRVFMAAVHCDAEPQGRLPFPCAESWDGGGRKAMARAPDRHYCIGLLVLERAPLAGFGKEDCGCGRVVKWLMI